MTFPTFVSAMPIQCFALDAIEKNATAIGRRLDAVAWVRNQEAEFDRAAPPMAYIGNSR